jgi:hypothetical protein
MAKSTANAPTDNVYSSIVVSATAPVVNGTSTAQTSASISSLGTLPSVPLTLSSPQVVAYASGASGSSATVNNVPVIGNAYLAFNGSLQASTTYTTDMLFNFNATVSNFTLNFNNASVTGSNFGGLTFEVFVNGIQQVDQVLATQTDVTNYFDTTTLSYSSANSVEVVAQLQGDGFSVGAELGGVSPNAQSPEVVATPEPSTWALLLGGGAVLVWWHRRRGVMRSTCVKP